MQWKFYNPVLITYNNESLEMIVSRVNQKKYSNIILVTYDWFKKLDYFKKLKKLIPKLILFDNVEENPSIESCQKAIDTVRNNNIDLIIAIGGGSVIDTAKVVRMAIYKNIFKIEKLFNNKNENINNIPELIVIPTTHGTGSELTMWATVWDKKNKLKKSLSEPLNYPDIAMYDINLVNTLPNKVALISTLDALSHAFESIWNKNANPISSNYAIEAIFTIVKNIHCFSGDINANNREDLIRASMLAGLAFSNTKTAAAHSISYPLTAIYNIPHGIACSITLRELCNFNQEKITHILKRLTDLLCIKSIDNLWDIVNTVIKDNVPFCLKEYGVCYNEIENIAIQCFTTKRINNNIIPLTVEDVTKILYNIYE